MGQRRVASPVTATTDLLAAAILNKYGRAFPAIDRALQRTLRPTAEGHHPSTVPARARAITS